VCNLPTQAARISVLSANQSIIHPEISSCYISAARTRVADTGGGAIRIFRGIILAKHVEKLLRKLETKGRLSVENLRENRY